MNSDAKAPRLAVTMGDPAGIGPEIILKALADPQIRQSLRPLVVGDPQVMQQTAQRLNLDLPVRALPPLPASGDLSGSPVEAWAAEPDDGRTLAVVQGSQQPAAEVPLGKVDPRAGRAAYDYIATAVRLTTAGITQAIVTAPINKAALAAAGVTHAGHTEILADLTGTRDYSMLLSGRTLRIAHVSTHISLRAACDAVRRERVATVARLLHQTLVRMGWQSPRIAVAGLNPHAGEGGLFGDEETEIAAGIQQAREEGIDASGPHPPDTLFYRARKGEFDGVVAMYHDQGHIPMKLVEFDTAVNITMGLPLWRVSVDHGTAFDIAGKGMADPTNMKEALQTAVRLAGD